MANLVDKNDNCHWLKNHVKKEKVLPAMTVFFCILQNP